MQAQCDPPHTGASRPPYRTGHIMPTLVLLLVLPGLPGPPVSGPHLQYAEARGQVALRTDLGDHHHPIRSGSPLAQSYFDQGLRLIFAMEGEAARASFAEAARHDPGCAPCWWGVALALGSNPTGTLDARAEEEAWEALRGAWVRVPRASPRERALVDALSRRYGREPGVDRAARDSAYADAMVATSRRYPHPDIHVLAAAALFQLPAQARARELLGRALAATPDHPGACLLLLRYLDPAGLPEARRCAASLPDEIPGVGRTVHAPAHLLRREGRYGEAMEVDARALDVDRRTRRGGPPVHLLESVLRSGVSGGREEPARAAVETLRSRTLRSPGEAPGRLRAAVVELGVEVRFGRWEGEGGSSRPPAPGPVVAGVWRMARGMARVVAGDLEAARRELRSLMELQRDPGILRVDLGPGPDASELLELSRLLLVGEIYRAEGRIDDALDAFQGAVALEDGLRDGGFPLWLLPARHWLGAALVEAGRTREARTVYGADLERRPANAWALAGLVAAWTREGEEDRAAGAAARLVRTVGAGGTAPPGSHYGVALAGSSGRADHRRRWRAPAAPSSRGRDPAPPGIRGRGRTFESGDRGGRPWQGWTVG